MSKRINVDEIDMLSSPKKTISTKKNPMQESENEKNLYPHSFRFSKKISQDVKIYSLLTKKSQNELMQEAFELWKKNQKFTQEEYKTAAKFV